MKINIFCLLALILLLFNNIASYSQSDTIINNLYDKVFYQKLNADIFPGAWREIKKGVETAEKNNCDVYVLELNTYGGEVSTADSIRTKILNANIPTIVWINDNAASAGALISISCDSIYMAKSAKIGASTVVNSLTGEGAIDKYQSYMRATFRATAEAKNRNPDIAEAMVDQDVEVEGIIEAGKTLTFTTSEAIKHNYCNAEINSRTELLKRINAEKAEVVMYEKSTLDSLIGWLMKPAISGMLITIILGGIYLELKTPGIGVGTLFAVCGAVLYFAPYYLEGLAENWEILIFFIGVLLLIVEIFLIPGFGIFGVAGITLIVGSLTFAMLDNDFFDLTNVADGKFSSSLFTVLVSTLLSMVLLILLGGTILKSNAFKRFELSEVQDSNEGYTVAVKEEAALVGETAIAITDLRISGRVKVKNKIFDVITTGEYIEEGTEVVLEKYQGRYFIVSKKA